MDENTAALREAGAAHLRAGRFAEAIAALREAVAAQPGDEMAWRLLGGALASSGDSQGAVDAFEKALTLQPASPKSHYNLGLALLQLDRKDEARTHLQEALDLDPSYAQARARLDELGPAPQAAAPPPLPRPAAPPPLTLTPVGGGAPPPAESPTTPTAYAPPGAYAPPPVLGQNYTAYGADENTSGQRGPVPGELMGGWNWGAFYFSALWLINHRLAPWGIALIIANAALARIPIVGAIVSLASIGLSVYLGIIGNRIGWQYRAWKSVDDFRACQRIWAIWALGVFIGSVILGIGLFILLMALGLMAGLSGQAPGVNGDAFPGGLGR